MGDRRQRARAAVASAYVMFQRTPSVTLAPVAISRQVVGSYATTSPPPVESRIAVTARSAESRLAERLSCRGARPGPRSAPRAGRPASAGSAGTSTRRRRPCHGRRCPGPRALLLRGRRQERRELARVVRDDRQRVVLGQHRLEVGVEDQRLVELARGRSPASSAPTRPAVPSASPGRARRPRATRARRPGWAGTTALSVP